MKDAPVLPLISSPFLTPISFHGYKLLVLEALHVAFLCQQVNVLHLSLPPQNWSSCRDWCKPLRAQWCRFPSCFLPCALRRHISRLKRKLPAGWEIVSSQQGCRLEILPAGEAVPMPSPTQRRWPRVRRVRKG
ncbi:hypothetical protein [Reticulibacter mediterranei]|uniref:hypothetical protein n=1 Tax=Reticulibacter mediterranei TaxID=2778369 RepID=UPI001C689EA3|nr:hypothetical protein [Reticulibacter mediterranei]